MARFSVKFWGTRGSVATPGEGTVRCGGNTPCLEMRCGERIIVLDAGTGIRPLGQALERQGVRKLTLLITHPHMDHLQGFPFFTLAYNREATLDIHLPKFGPEATDEPLHKLMEGVQFPVIFSKLPAQVNVHRMNGGLHLGEVEVRCHAVNHPGGCLAYRFTYGGKVFVYLTDHEPWRRIWPRHPESDTRDRELLEFTRGADLLVREAQYTPEEYEERRGWGHSTFDDALADALAAGVKKLVLFHHDPDHDDVFLENQLAALEVRKGSAELEILLAREGQTIELL